MKKLIILIFLISICIK